MIYHHQLTAHDDQVLQLEIHNYIYSGVERQAIELVVLNSVHDYQPFIFNIKFFDSN